MKKYLKSRMKEMVKDIKPIVEASKVALLYGFLGVFWIAFPDQILSKMVNDTVTFQQINIYKGMTYVVLTAILIFLLVYKRLLLFDNALKNAQNNLSQQKDIEKKLHQFAYFDMLTGLPNRRLFETSVTSLLRSGVNGQHALLYIDIDNFKNINDTLGHLFGDSFLKHIAGILQNNITSKDLVSRLSGDEFAIFLKDIKDEQEVINKVQSLLSQLRKPWIVHNRDYYAFVSIGVAMYPEHGQNISLLLRNSDIAMYHVKKDLKNNYCFFSEKLKIEKVKQITIVNELHRALENDEFILFYQPIMNLYKGTLSGVEALIRWNHPERGLVSPAEFIPIAEETSLINDIGSWVLKKAFYQKKEWDDKGFTNIKMSINVSGRTLVKPGFINEISDLLRETGINSKEIQLEITESALIEKINISNRVLLEISQMGIGIALDDFGTGYSSLTYLKNLPIDVVKLDGTFVKGLMNDGQDSVIVESVIQLTHDLSLTMVAEGVENNEQLSILKYNRCDYGQGYLFSRPLPKEEIEGLMV